MVVTLVVVAAEIMLLAGVMVEAVGLTTLVLVSLIQPELILDMVALFFHGVLVLLCQF